MLSYIVDGVDVFNPIEGKLDRLIEYFVDFYGEEKGIRVARKTILDYLRGRGFQGKWRGRAALVGSKEEFLRILAEAPQYQNEEYWRTSDAGKNADRRLSNR